MIRRLLSAGVPAEVLASRLAADPQGRLAAELTRLVAAGPVERPDLCANRGPLPDPSRCGICGVRLAEHPFRSCWREVST